MTDVIIKPVRCAVYTRKSTDDGLDMSFNSLDAQRDSAEAYIRSQTHDNWILVPDEYNDAAISGGTMERPALKRLLDDVKTGRIDIVVVYKIDRLSRSLVDFANIAKMLEEYDAGFVSVTEKFDTSSAIGKLHLNIIISFAQFEREQAGERIRDKFAASRKRGIWMGGPPPLGYDVSNRKLLVNHEEALLVRDIFERFTLIQSSTELVKLLRSEGVTSKSYITQKGVNHQGKLISPSVLHHILRNPVYAGKATHKDSIYDGQHDAIVSPELWKEVQSIFGVSPRKRAHPHRTKTSSLLNGMVTCQGCDCAMTHTYTRKKTGKLYRYYVPSAKRRHVCNNCPVGSISASELERVVLDHIQKIATSPDMILRIWREVNDNGLDIDESQIREQLKNFTIVYENLFPAEKQRLVKLFIKKVVMTPEGANIHLWNDGLEQFFKEMNVDIKPIEKESNYEITHEPRPEDSNHPCTHAPEAGGM